MRVYSNIALVSLAALLALASPSAALDLGVKDNTPIDVVGDQTPIDVNDNTPVNVHDFTPINIANPTDGINDAVLSAKQMRVALRQGLILLSCKLGDDDLLVANAGSVDLPAGTKLKWSVESYDVKGYAQLKSSLEVGQTVRVADVIDGPSVDGTRCAAKVTGL